MPKEIAIGKRAKISEAQQYMLMAVFGASIFLGVAVSLVSHFFKQISFNAEIIIAQDKAIDAYSDTIKSIGICKKSRAKAYSKDELNNCDPDSIEISEIPGTLRAKILEELAANQALSSVPRDAGPSCINPNTDKKYTYDDLNEIYDQANGADELIAASNLIKRCSALRVIPDALPAFRNEEALLASLDKIFRVSGREPESLSPSGTTTASDLGTGLHAVLVNLAIEEATTRDISVLLSNIERSIRDYDVASATFSWSGENSIGLRAQATAYYRDESSITEVSKTIKVNKEKK